MRLRYSWLVREQLRSLQRYIFEHDPSAGRRIAVHIRAVAETLKTFPHMGHIGMVPKTYELFTPSAPYMLVYELDLRKHGREKVFILGIYHTAQDRVK